MRRKTLIGGIVVALTMGHAGVAMPKKRVITSLGTRATHQQVDPRQRALDLIGRAFTDADAWWTAQGTTPTALDLQYGDSFQDATGRNSAMWASTGSGRVTVGNRYVDALSGILSTSTRKGKRAALTNLWGLAAHERGHNLGYTHETPGIPLMADGVPFIPDRGSEWALSTLPARHTRVLQGAAVKPSRRTQPYRKGARMPGEALAAMTRGRQAGILNPADQRRALERMLAGMRRGR